MSTKIGDDTDTVGNIEKFLQECLEGMEPDHKLKGPGRPRVLPAMALWAGLLVCVLRGFGSQLAVWRLISERGLWFFPRFPVTDQAVYKRLHTAGTKPLERLFEQISIVLAERLQGVFSEKLAPFAEDVVCIDESTLDTMSRTLPTLRGVPQGDTSAPIWRVRCETPAGPSGFSRTHIRTRRCWRDLVAELPEPGGGRLGILRLRLV